MNPLAALLLAGATPFIANAQVPLISAGATWKYDDRGLDLGTAWQAPAFNDTTWLSGAAQLGYGDSDEATTINFGPNPESKFITYYFRRAFNVASPTTITNLRARLLRDDGGVVYLNGTEVFRSNMPEGPIGISTLASAAAANADETIFFNTNINAALLVAGNNVVAVEIHQSAANSSDVSFDFQLLGNPLPEIAFVSPTNGQVLTALNIPLSVTATPGGQSVVQVRYFANGTPVGTANTPPFNVLWSDVAAGSYTMTATVTDSSGLMTTSSPIGITVKAIPASTLVNRGDVWKYNNLNVDLGTAWRDPGYNDNTWASGPAPVGSGLLFNGEIPLATSIDIGPDGGRYPTVYFRRTFNVANPAAYVGLIVNLLRDDAAALYLNGQSVVRDGVGTGAGFNDFALQTVADANEITYFQHLIPATSLVSGLNTIAVEVKNVGSTSSDLAFDMDMVGDLIPIVNLVSPVSGQVFPAQSPINIAAEAIDDTAIVRVQFFDGINLIGEDVTSPYTLSWSGAVDGDHTLTATAFDTTGHSGTSAPVMITVSDPNPPALVSVNATTNTVNILFSKRITEQSATRLLNYAIANLMGSVTVFEAVLQSPGNRVLLSTGPMTEGNTYTLTVNNIQDLSEQTIAPNSQIQFTVQQFVLADVGTPALPGSQTPVPGGFNVSGSGTNILGSADQLTLSYVERTDDFDLMVRVSSLALSDSWAKAGLMARESLAGNTRFAAALATPGAAGSFFQSRSATAAAAVSDGSFPVNYPYTWLRLRREDDLFTGFAGLDGQNWKQLGQITLANAPRPMLVGLAVSSGRTGVSTTAGFRDFLEVTGTPGTLVSFNREPLGPSTRRTSLVISEIMYHPANVPGITGSLEFIEIYNGQDFVEDLSGFKIDGDVHYTFPAGVLLNSGAFVVLARDPATLQSFYGISGVLGPWRMVTNVTSSGTVVTTENLPNNRGTVRLENELGAHLVEVNYDSEGPWPVQADGAGHSLVLARPSYGEANPQAWAASDLIGGSPGKGEAYLPDPLRAVVLNEILAHTDPPLFDYIELFNTSTQAVTIGGCYITDDADTNKFQIPAGMVLGPRSFRSFSETELGFRLSADGEDIFLVNAAKTKVLDAVRFGGQENGVSYGRYPDGAPGFQDLSTRTGGTPNTPPLQRSIVINEIMYHPISGNGDDEYVEIHNRGPGTVDLSLWSFDDAISYTFPVGSSLAQGGYLVVAKNRTNLLARYPNLAAIPSRVLGNFDGQLADRGDRLVLAMPDINLETNGTIIITNVFYITVDEVTYHDGGRWGQWSDGGGSSLELIDARTDNRLAANWADSDESQKASWALVERTGPLQLGMTAGNGTPNRFEMFLQGPGECLVDDVECRLNGGGNLISNPGFESGTTGWAFQGTHARSAAQSGGAFAGAAALRLSAVERGDTGPNKIRTAIPTLTTGPGNDGTLRTRARWLRGDTNLFLRVRGQWLECAGVLPVPTNLGTPGAANSRALANIAPAISEVIHAPILPGDNEPVLVTARVHDPDGVASLTLRYRLDPATSFSNVTMRDDGAQGDAIAGDGIWSGRLPGRSAGTLVAFHLQATDTRTPAATSLFPTDAPFRECLVRFGERLYPGSLGNYRLWVTQSNLTYWAARERNSNEGLDATFVYGDWRVVYNAKTLYSGSPFHTPEYNGPLGTIICDYEVEFPKDDLFLGEQDFVLSGQNSVTTFFQNDTSAQAESTAYWFGRQLGLGFNHKRHVVVFLNGQRRGMIYFDHAQPNSESIQAYFPNDQEGRLHKIEDWFEFDDAGGGFNYITALMADYRVNGQRRTERYRWNFRPRAGTHPNDFEDLMAMVDAANAPGPEPYTSALPGQMDVRVWMRTLAMQHMTGNWDSYGYRRGKNMYAYKPTLGPWRLVLWDLDLVLGKNSDGTTQNLMDTGGEGDPAIARMFQTPPFAREFWGALQELADGPMRSQNYNFLIDARYQAFQANGLPVDSPQAMKNWIDGRRSYILSQMPTAPFSVAGPTSFTSPSNYVILAGTAPVSVKEIRVNGVAHQVTWTAITGWSLSAALNPGPNTLLIEAVGANGAVLGSQTLNVNYSGTAILPEGFVVFNELMYDSPRPDTAFLELRNTHATAAFDLSLWRVDGMDYSFPAGTVLGPNGYIALVENRGEFSKLFGGTAVIFAQANGKINPAGETLTLFRPGPVAGQELVVDKLRFEGRAPWPITQTGGTPSSVQLIDPTQDNARVANWSVGSAWKLYTFTGVPGATRLTLWPDAAGVVYIDDMRYEAGSTRGAGANLLVNGGFESPLAPNWQLQGANGAPTTVTTAQKYTGNSCLELRFNAAGDPFNYLFQNIIGSTPSATHTLSFYYLPSSNVDNIRMRMSGSFLDLFPVRSTEPAGRPLATPSQPNSLQTSVPPFPLIWLNEVQPLNTTGITDNVGDREPWIELFNSGPTTIFLDDYYLSAGYVNLAQWRFPAGTSLAPNQFKIVYADGETAEGTATAWHTNFRLDQPTGSLALSRFINNGMQIVDFLNFDNLFPDRSYGSFPDGQLFDRRQFFFVTPGAPNNGASPPLTVSINEWMAANDGFILDPADSDEDDWIELYNAGPDPANLGGFFLTDDLADIFKYPIPNNGQYVIPPHGYLLVWADGETGQNLPTQPDLHTSFNLRAGGEAIGLFAADGTRIDSLTFGAQTDNISEGRFPDGNAARYSMNFPTPRSANTLMGQPVAPPFMNLMVLPNGHVTFSFATEVGRVYQVFYKNDLNLPGWAPFTAPMNGTGNPIVIDDDTAAQDQRFYQISVE